MIHASILGASGYVGLELIRLLHSHPDVRIRHLVSSSAAGESIAVACPHLANQSLASLPALEALDIATLAKDTDVFFTALPHGASQDVVAQLAQSGKVVIDMSGDFRYDDPLVYAAWYGKHHYPELLQQAIYGLPELYAQQIASAQLIANPGCYTTCSILALAPLLQQGLVEPDSLLIDAKSGSSGAGKKATPSMMFCEVDENMRAYSVGTHRHTSEIEQELGKLAQQAITLQFTPHLLPVKRGILATSYARLQNSMDVLALLDIYRAFYEHAPFVHICPQGQLPELQHVVGSNQISIGLTVDLRTRRVIVVSCLDNLIKGAAGQAVQNMNLRFQLPQTSGLDALPWYL